MSIHLVRQPTYEIQCDHPGCTKSMQDFWEYGLRQQAASAGWLLRPRMGKGSRTAPDLCAEHGGAS